MKLLLDTHLLLWTVLRSHRLSAAARGAIGDPSNQPLFSPVSLWEIAIKRAIDRPDFDVEARVVWRGLCDRGYEELAVTTEHALTVGTLPAVHKDPFDRLLIAQATAEGVTLLTADRRVARYPGPVRLV